MMATNPNVVTLSSTEGTELTFDLDITASGPLEIQPSSRLFIESDGVELCFPCNANSDGSTTTNINVHANKFLVEGIAHACRLEVNVDGRVFVPLIFECVVEKPTIIEAKLKNTKQTVGTQITARMMTESDDKKKLALRKRLDDIVKIQKE